MKEWEEVCPSCHGNVAASVGSRACGGLGTRPASPGRYPDETYELWVGRADDGVLFELRKKGASGALAQGPDSTELQMLTECVRDAITEDLELS